MVSIFINQNKYHPIFSDSTEGMVYERAILKGMALLQLSEEGERLYENNRKGM